MKTLNCLRNTVLVLLLVTTASIVVGQGLKSSGKSDIRAKLHMSLNAAPVTGFYEKSEKLSDASKSLSDYASLVEFEAEKAMENAGYLIDAVVVNYDKTAEDKSLTRMGYAIDPVVVTFPAKSIAVTHLDNNEFTPAEIAPSIEEGVNLNTTIRKYLKYPECAIAQKIEGTVLITFTVDTQGNVTNTKVLQDIGGHCGLYAAQAVSQMKFKPAKQNGYTVPCRMVIPVEFKLM